MCLTSTKYVEHAGYRCLSNINNRQTSDLYLTHCGIQKCLPLHSWGPDSREEYHMHFILNGEGYLEINNHRYHLIKGQIFLLPPNISVHYYADEQNPWYYAWVGFNGEKAKDYLKQAGFSDTKVISTPEIHVESFSSLINEMLLAKKLTSENELVRVGYLYQLISLLIESHQNDSKEISSHDYSLETYVTHAVQYIKFNYNTNLKISELVNYIGINRSYLSNAFTKILGMSPKEYLTSYRLQEAKKQLRTSTISIKEVARNVGYSDPFAFSKIFHQTVGMSPSEYRTQHL